MNLDSYPVISSEDLLTHTFISEGPKGQILKHIKFQHLTADRYNLAFGDWVDDTELLNDTVRTNNNDREKVLATVAKTVRVFLNVYPTVRIEVQGSTTSRTRLYQIKLIQHLHEIHQEYNIQGFRNGQWETFDARGNYTSFSIISKCHKHEEN